LCRCCCCCFCGSSRLSSTLSYPLKILRESIFALVFF
jgi:hypothetical protein